MNLQLFPVLEVFFYTISVRRHLLTQISTTLSTVVWCANIRASGLVQVFRQCIRRESTLSRSLYGQKTMQVNVVTLII